MVAKYFTLWSYSASQVILGFLTYHDKQILVEHLIHNRKKEEQGNLNMEITILESEELVNTVEMITLLRIKITGKYDHIFS